jgi:hypothetical protein
MRNRKQNKNWILILLLGISLLGILIYNNPDKLNIFFNFSNSPSIKELSLNPSDYLNQSVSVRGVITYSSGEGQPYRFKDNSNYYILIEPNSCVWGVQRQYKYDGTETYIANGIFLKGYSAFYEDFYYLQCSTHLE